MIDIEEIKPRIAVLAQKHSLLMVVLFGSQATGTTHQKSDADFAILTSSRIGPADIGRIAYDFSHELKMKDVDIAVLNGASPLLLQQVAKKGVLLYESERSLFARLRMYAFKRFVEAKPLLSLRKAQLREFVESAHV